MLIHDAINHLDTRFDNTSTDGEAVSTLMAHYHLLRVYKEGQAARDAVVRAAVEFCYQCSNAPHVPDCEECILREPVRKLRELEGGEHA